MTTDIAKLEILIEAACREAVRMGRKIGQTPRHACPLHAVCIVNGSNIGTGEASRALGLDVYEEHAFVRGYDGPAGGASIGPPEMFALGAKFRARVDAGEFSKERVCP